MIIKLIKIKHTSHIQYSKENAVEERSEITHLTGRNGNILSNLVD